MVEADSEIALFPLHTVLFPGGPLALRIFETRYLDMVSRCMKAGEPFGVCLIRTGDETGRSEFRTVGTRARIQDWYQERNGLLGIVCLGEERFRVVEHWQQPDGLNRGRVREVPAERDVALPEEHVWLARLLERLLDQFPAQYALVERDFASARWVGCRLAEVLPLNLEQKQFLLELDDPLRRLGILTPLVESLRFS
ncbi:MAG: LON peptidase substrate-binding domain-containing protein [Gammaproteobacteria bacterium]|jgi:Lon protease-like protein